LGKRVVAPGRADDIKAVMESEKSVTCPLCCATSIPVSVGECPRCAHLWRKRGASGHDVSLACATAALVLFLSLLVLPLVEVSKIGFHREIRLGELGAALAGQGMGWLGRYVDFCVVAAPAALLLGMIPLLAAAAAGRAFPGWRAVLALTCFAGRWAMAEVLLLAILISFLKIDALADAAVGAGCYALAGASVCILLAWQAFDPAVVRARLDPAAPDPKLPAPAHRGSLDGSIALFCAAAFALVPANLLPMMEISIAGRSSGDTIFGGVVLLVREGMWGIGLVVFVASFIVPIGKLAGLARLFWLARRGGGGPGAVRLHRLLDFIGRWSMLDILLIALLAGLIQFQGLAYVKPGPAAPAFAAAVVFTILAVELFPLRALFPSGASAGKRA
jgi:paraquat-inducible protein A